MCNILQKPLFKKTYKKLALNQRPEVNAAIRAIAADPKIGEAKRPILQGYLCTASQPAVSVGVLPGSERRYSFVGNWCSQWRLSRFEAESSITTESTEEEVVALILLRPLVFG